MEEILERIYKASLKLLEPLDSESTYEIIVKEAIKLVGANYGSLLVSIDGELTEVYSTLPLKIKRRKKGNTYKAFKEDQAYVLHKNVFGKTHPELAKLGLISNLYLPISYRKKSIGVLIVNSKKKCFGNPVIEVFFQFPEENKVYMSDCYIDKKNELIHFTFIDHDFPLEIKNMCKKYCIMKAFW